MIGGIGCYTIFSEGLNTKVKANWAYRDLMPVVLLLDVGLSPIAQWTVIPRAGFWLARRATADTLIFSESF